MNMANETKCIVTRNESPMELCCLFFGRSTRGVLVPGDRATMFPNRHAARLAIRRTVAYSERRAWFWGRQDDFDIWPLVDAPS